MFDGNRVPSFAGGGISAAPCPRSVVAATDRRRYRWSAEARARLPKDARDEAEAQTAKIARWWAELEARNATFAAAYDVDAFAHEVLLVSSRSFGVQAVGEVDSPVQLPRRHAMMPVADQFNHHVGKKHGENAGYDFMSKAWDGSGYALTAWRDVAAGAELETSYGRRARADLVVNYGFSADVAAANGPARDAFAEMIEWFETECVPAGGALAPGLSRMATGTRGVETARAIEKGAVVASVPAKCFITEMTAAAGLRERNVPVPTSNVAKLATYLSPRGYSADESRRRHGGDKSRRRRGYYRMDSPWVRRSGRGHVCSRREVNR